MSKQNRIKALRELGQSIWYDTIRRDLLDSGELARMIREDGLGGLTSNPAIFDQAITGTELYAQGIRDALTETPDATDEALFHRIAIDDLQRAADAFLPLYEDTDGADGFVSLEVSPALAHDTEATVREARKLFQDMDRPNTLIKVPGTRAGVAALETLISDGINVNVTLLFSVTRYTQVLEAWMRGLEARQERGEPIDRVASVASFFISRVDGALDPLLEGRIKEGAPVEHLRGRLAIANARLAYAHFLDQYGSARFSKLTASGARPQRLLWASTGTKNPDYSDVLYVDELIGEHTVNTVPPATYAAFLDHGTVAATLSRDLNTARAELAALPDLGIDLESITDHLETQGLQTFEQAYEHLLQGIAGKRRDLAGNGGAKG